MANPQVSAEEHGGKTTRRGKRGSTDNKSRLAGLQRSEVVRGTADWGNAGAEWLQAVITAATLRGLAISFSLSRDGGAHGLLLLDNGERVQLWFNGEADLDRELEQVFSYLESMPQ